MGTLAAGQNAKWITNTVRSRYSSYSSTRRHRVIDVTFRSFFLAHSKVLIRALILPVDRF